MQYFAEERELFSPRSPLPSCSSAGLFFFILFVLSHCIYHRHDLIAVFAAIIAFKDVFRSLTLTQKQLRYGPAIFVGNYFQFELDSAVRGSRVPSNFENVRFFVAKFQKPPETRYWRLLR